MKKLTILSILFISLAFVVPTPALAQTDAGPTPGSFWYGITTTFENVNLFFTFNSEKKAEKALSYAERRLEQAKAAAEGENSKAVEIALTDYEAKIALASESSKKIKDNERAKKLLTSIADNTSRHQEALSGVLEKVPEEAREAIVRAIEVSKRGQEEATRQIVELKGEIEQLRQEIAELKEAQDESLLQPQETVRLEAETERAKSEAERLLREEQAQKATEEQRRLELQQQKMLEDQARELELQRQREAQKVFEEQQQRERARVNQINNQIQSLLSEYNAKIATIDGQILAIRQKYYEDEKKIKSQPIPMAFITSQIQKLAQEADAEINQLYLEQERLRLEYQEKIGELESQL